MNRTEYEQWLKSDFEYHEKAEAVFEKWAEAAGVTVSSILFVRFDVEEFVVTYYGANYDYSYEEKTLSIEYLFSDACVEEMETGLRLEREEAELRAAQKKANDQV